MEIEEPCISEYTFGKFAKLIYSEIGIYLPVHKKIMLEGRIKKRMRKLLIDSYEKYFNYVLESNDERIEFYNVVSTNKTEFFRENQHFDIIIKNLPEIIKINEKNDKKLSIWSSASSSGEEAYSILITLMEHFEILKTWKLKIIASDISTAMLEQGKIGEYSDYKIENIDKYYLEKYFSKLGENKFKIKENLKKYVIFKRINLKDQTYPFKGMFEIIFCRNILIYFDYNTKLNVLKNIIKYLKHNGILVLGTMEPLSYESERELGLKKIDSTVYKKII